MRARFAPPLALLALLSAGAAAADEKKKDGDKPAGADPFGELFGDSLNDDDVDLKDLTKGVHKEKRGSALKPKTVEIKDKATIKLERVFAAQSIRMHRQRGCEPADRNRTKIVTVTVDGVPSRTPGFAVCLTLAADAHREMRISTAIMSPQNRRIAKAESVVDFRGKPIVDHIMEFPPVEVDREGQYFYQVDIDGKPVGRLLLFEVKKLAEEG